MPAADAVILRQTTPGAPLVVMNATDMESAEVFAFTPQRFDDLCSDLDQLPLGAACGNGQRQLMQMAAAIAEQRQHGADVGRDALDELWQTVLAGAIHLAKQLVPHRAEIILKCVAA